MNISSNYIIIAVILLISIIWLSMKSETVPDSGYENSQLMKKEDQAVVSQTGIVKPSYKQILENRDLIPGNQSEVWPAENLHRYCTGTIEDQPYGSPASAGALLDWRQRESDWQTEYSEKAIKTDLSNVKFYSGFDNYKDVKSKGLINFQYYHNPDKYCVDNPSDYPCPKYWIKDKKPILSVSGTMTFAGFPPKKKHVKFNIPPESVVKRDNLSYRGYI